MKSVDRYTYISVYILNIFKIYIYGFLGKFFNLTLYVKPKNLLFLLSCLKKDSLIALKSLLDIAVLDDPKNSKIKGRFMLNYVLLNYVYGYRLIIRVLTDGLNPLFSVSKLYKSSD